MILIRFRKETDIHKKTFDERFPWRNRYINISNIDGTIQKRFFLSRGFLTTNDYRYRIPKSGAERVGDLFFVIKDNEIHVVLLDGFIRGVI